MTDRNGRDVRIQALAQVPVAMKRFILTGAPGAGKTSILRALAADGYAVVSEAATDVVASRLALDGAGHWADPRR